MDTSDIILLVILCAGAVVINKTVLKRDLLRIFGRSRSLNATITPPSQTSEVKHPEELEEAA